MTLLREVEIDLATERKHIESAKYHAKGKEGLFHVLSLLERGLLGAALESYNDFRLKHRFSGQIRNLFFQMNHGVVFHTYVDPEEHRNCEA